MTRDRGLTVLAFVAGAAIWIAITAASGRREAWDSELYFMAGIPALIVLALVLGYLAPRSSWRWGVWPLAGQFAWMLVTQGPGNLLPLGIVVFAFFAIPGVVAARIGAAIARTRARRDES